MVFLCDGVQHAQSRVYRQERFLLSLAGAFRERPHQWLDVCVQVHRTRTVSAGAGRAARRTVDATTINRAGRRLGPGAFPVGQLGIRKVIGAQARYLDVPLDILNHQLVARDGEVASGGIALPIGNVADLRCLRLVRQDPYLGAVAVPAQFHQLGVGHNDGSLKWVFVQTPITDTKAIDLAAAARVGGYYRVTPNELGSEGLTPEPCREQSAVLSPPVYWVFGMHC